MRWESPKVNGVISTMLSWRCWCQSKAILTPFALMLRQAQHRAHRERLVRGNGFLHEIRLGLRRRVKSVFNQLSHRKWVPLKIQSSPKCKAWKWAKQASRVAAARKTFLFRPT